MMYDWLKHETDQVRTRGFHKFAGRPSDEEATGFRIELASFPNSYIDFIITFGESELYREWQRDKYGMRIFGRPRQVADVRGGDALFHVGWCDRGNAYFRAAELSRATEAPVWLGRGAGLSRAGGFETWLTDTSSRLRRAYGKRGWANVVRGPAPFSEREREVVEARRKFAWRAAGLDPNGNVRFVVTNGSSTTLPGLSIGVRAPDFVGGVALPVGALAPGATREFSVDCYRDLLDPGAIEFFAYPDPEPENRGEYWELGNQALVQD